MVLSREEGDKLLAGPVVIAARYRGEARGVQLRGEVGDLLGALAVGVRIRRGGVALSAEGQQEPAARCEDAMQRSADSYIASASNATACARRWRAPPGLAVADLDALEHLEAGPLTQRELGERLLLSSGGTTVLVDRLERGGWAHRRPHPDDRRSVLVELSDRARTQQPDVLAGDHAAVDAAARAVPREHRAAPIEFLDHIAGEAPNGATRLARGA